MWFFHVWLLSLSIMFSRFIHILPCVSTLFLFYDWMIFHWMNRPCFVSPFISWWTVGLSSLWTITNNTTMNIHVQVLSGHMFSVLLGIYLRVGLLGHMVCLYLAFWGTIKWFSKVATSVYIPTSTKSCNFSASSPTLVIICLFNYSYPSGYKVVYSCGFDLNFSHNYWSWTSFHVLFALLSISFVF